jgi:hypothetical protein
MPGHSAARADRGRLIDPSALVLLAAKIVASAFFVLGGTAAAEWLGPRLGSIVGSTPSSRCSR